MQFSGVQTVEAMVANCHVFFHSTRKESSLRSSQQCGPLGPGTDKGTHGRKWLCTVPQRRQIRKGYNGQVTITHTLRQVVVKEKSQACGKPFLSSWTSHKKCSDCTLPNGVKPSRLLCLPVPLFQGLAPSPQSKGF